MFDFSEVSLQSLIIHKVGSNQEENSLNLSEHMITPENEEIEQVLVDFFMKPFKPDAFYHFDHESGLEVNDIYQNSKAIFENRSAFVEKSQFIARHLHYVSVHPNIKTGELYIAHFNGCVVDGEITDAIGIFKSENKDTFLKIVQQNHGYDVDMQTGINIKKLDKGCLIFNTEADDGYKLSIVDKTNKSQEAMYWMNDFLKVQFREDDFYDTKNYIDLCKAFSDGVLTEENSFSTPDQITFMKRSKEYFENNEKFDEQNFAEQVIHEPDIIDAFNGFKEEYKVANETEPNSDFGISKPALKKQNKYFRPVIKLDKNFHLYVHGNPDNMEKGYDDNRRMTYYKLFFHEEN
ncbi:MAG: nucleoid-associated protein [Salinivirgaceae bacterium]